jgi:hypothetical protein
MPKNVATAVAQPGALRIAEVLGFAVESMRSIGKLPG